jgi:hypothetical protein
VEGGTTGSTAMRIYEKPEETIRILGERVVPALR